MSLPTYTPLDPGIAKNNLLDAIKYVGSIGCEGFQSMECSGKRCSRPVECAADPLCVAADS